MPISPTHLCCASLSYCVFFSIHHKSSHLFFIFFLTFCSEQHHKQNAQVTDIHHTRRLDSIDTSLHVCQSGGMGATVSSLGRHIAFKTFKFKTGRQVARPHDGKLKEKSLTHCNRCHDRLQLFISIDFSVNVFSETTQFKRFVCILIWISDSR